MKIDIITLFPDMFRGPFDESIVKRAQEKGHVQIQVHNLRNWTIDKHKTVDGRPYSGGPGMILRIDVIDRALKDLAGTYTKKAKIVLLDAGGKKYDQKKAVQLSKVDHLIILCGHYEGVDHRVHKYLVDEVISVGNYVLSGGEIPAMTMVDSIVRLIPDVIDPESLKEESFSGGSGKKEYSQYTRPEVYNNWKVPRVLLSGNHKEIEDWKKRN